MRSVIVALFTVAAAAPLAAQGVATAVAPPAAAPVAASAADTAIECRREVATGSMMPKRVCKPHAQWQAEARASDALTPLNRGGSVGPNR